MIGRCRGFGQVWRAFVIVLIKKEDAAYLYQILESYEGLTNFSTLDSPKEDVFRKIELHMPKESKPEIVRLLNRLKSEMWIEFTE
jgi:hypothetical protein